ncbi:MAG: hypothetical protein J3K34DRAFT_518480 [Monoraphidium minutum]|nr:MAG: hypothetical protein J3K34DRAFT_518480 [Monoraphidium minutum]
MSTVMRRGMLASAGCGQLRGRWSPATAWTAVAPSRARWSRCAPSASGGVTARFHAEDASPPLAPAAAPDLSQIEPYVVWERVSTLTAFWDPREHDEAEFPDVERQLLACGAHSVELSHAPGVGGRQGRLQLTVTCPQERALTSSVAAVILQATAAADVRLGDGLRCGLPREAVAVATPWGRVRVEVALKGSEPFKASPRWEDCEAAAAAAAAAAGGAGARGGAPPPAAAPAPEDVAAAALEVLEAGLVDGGISLGAQYLF